MQKLKNNEARPKFTGSYKKKVCMGMSRVDNQSSELGVDVRRRVFASL